MELFLEQAAIAKLVGPDLVRQGEPVRPDSETDIVADRTWCLCPADCRVALIGMA